MSENAESPESAAEEVQVHKMEKENGEKIQDKTKVEDKDEIVLEDEDINQTNPIFRFSAIA